MRADGSRADGSRAGPAAVGPMDGPDPIAAGAGRRKPEPAPGRIGAARAWARAETRVGREPELREPRAGHADLYDSSSQYSSRQRVEWRR